MKIIISPAKKMREDDILPPKTVPVFLKDTEEILAWLRTLDRNALKKLWACSDRIADQNLQRLAAMDLYGSTTAALFAYDGIQYQYMAPNAFMEEELRYVQEHLRILSGFYGVLKPMDGVVPYRLEMQARTDLHGKDLYEYWNDRLYREVLDDSRIIVNLASEEYAGCIAAYTVPGDTFLTCTFAEDTGEKLISKGVYCKMARGAMVRWMAENHTEDIQELKAFTMLDYAYSAECSTDTEYVFIRKKGS